MLMRWVDIDMLVSISRGGAIAGFGTYISGSTIPSDIPSFHVHFGILHHVG